MEFTISLLNVNWLNLKAICQTLLAQNIRHLHLDIMDGQFTPAVSFGASVVSHLKAQFPRLLLSGHFMVKIPPKQSLAQYLTPYVGLDSVIFHLEHLRSPQIAELKAWKQTTKKQIGLAITLTTPWTKIRPYLSGLDYVLLMLVPLGQGGQKLAAKGLQNLQAVLNYFQANRIKTAVIADGGINLLTLPLLPSKLDYAVLGSYCWQGRSLKTQLQKITTAWKGLQLQHGKPRRF